MIVRASRFHWTGAARFALCVVVLACGTTRASDHTEIQRANAQRVANEMRSAIRFAASATERVLTEQEVRVEPLETGAATCRSVTAVRLSTPASPHDQKFILAIDHHRLFRLGGFSSPDVADLVAAARRRRKDAMPPADLSRCLAWLLDPNGATMIVPLGDPATDEGDSLSVLARKQWVAMRPGYDTRDTVVVRSDGSIWVRIGLLSGREQAGGWQWTWRSYVFSFNSAGLLLVWHVREDEPVVIPYRSADSLPPMPD